MKVRAVVKVTAEILILFYALLICGFVGFEKVFNFVKCLMFAIFLAIGHLAIFFAICYFDSLFAICNFAIFFLVTFKEISKFLFQWLFGFIGLILYFLVMLLEKWEKNLKKVTILYWAIVAMKEIKQLKAFRFYGPFPLFKTKMNKMEGK